MKVGIRINGRLPIYLNSSVEIDGKKVIIEQVEVSEGDTRIAGVLSDKKASTEATEWENGDTAYVENCTHDEIKFIGLSGNSAVAVCECVTESRKVILDKFWVSDLLKEKPETPEQRKERERLEAAYDLYDAAILEVEGESYTFDYFRDGIEIDKESMVEFMKFIVDKTNYRKGE